MGIAPSSLPAQDTTGRARRDGGRAEDDRASLWIDYFLFELEHGGTRTARAMADAAANV
jgi:hypothetical protein